MWWTNWTIEKEYTPDEVRNANDVQEHALGLFSDRDMMYPCIELIKASTMFIKQSIFDIQSLPSWHKSRICLIGDAAHAVSPNAGLGAAVALEDTSLLALLFTRTSLP